jgi:hypothetical protein
MPNEITPSRIGIYKNIHDNSSRETSSIETFLQDVQAGRWQDYVLNIRTIKELAQRQEAKKKIPYVTISGVFKEGRAAAKLSAHSGLLAIDLDKLYSEVEEVKTLLSKDPYVFACFTSVSGTGLCALFKIKPDKHIESFDAIADYLIKNYGLLCDPSCKDVSRPRYVSFDPDLYWNEKAATFKKYLPKVNTKKPAVIFIQTEFDRIIKEMVDKNVSCVEDYRDWRDVGFAIADQFGEQGREYFHSLSEISGKYDPAICDKQFDISLKRDDRQAGKITIATIYWHAKNAGIKLHSNEVSDLLTAISDFKQEGLPAESIKESLKKEGIKGYDDLIEQALESDIESKGSIVTKLIRYIKRKYSLERNVITGRIENSGVPMADEDFNSMYLECKIFFEQINADMFTRIMHSRNIPDYNPIHRWFEQHKEIRPTGVIDRYFSAFKTDSDLLYFGKKWLVSLISAAYDEHSPLELIYAGQRHGSGKTEAFRRLLPKELMPYYAEIKEGTKETDLNIMLTKKWLVLDDECGNKTKKDALHFKSLLSTQVFTVRKPYGHNSEDIRRLAVMCGTSNYTGLLNDPTGNRRQIVVEIQNIDFIELDKIDRTELLMEAYHLYFDLFDWKIEGSNIDRLAKQSENFNEISSEKETLQKYFTFSETGFMTTTEIKNRMEILTVQKYSLRKIGLELTNLNYKRLIKKINGVPVYGYKIGEISTFDPENDL